MMKIKDGSSSIIVITLMLVVLTVVSFGFILLISNSNEQAAIVNGDPVNFSGINYTSEIYNGTNSTLHGLSQTMPNFIWIILIFIILAILAIVGLTLKR